MLTEIVQALVWEWVNIALEYTSVAWVRLPRFWLAVVCVNLLTHPVLMCLLTHFGHETGFILACEGGVVLVEWMVLVIVYGRQKLWFLGGLAFLMNTVSYGTGVLLGL